ncbi:LuxR C-terminal-related transcriptional regulator [Paenibacillus flagellatus]|uniref:HTH luxR-type domain-containing protein n=1 Tax=Paenibacillus flagellatus TaxID=2211139 RepID=A0A2V5KNN5_9BACL|nr:LuxR C-terminal-related transcriptional regulator [Paenibacillus flagellatus]PYI56900.1 hypothetical protein DLM86_00145 [Paenibacillus flagellatus]
MRNNGEHGRDTGNGGSRLLPTKLHVPENPPVLVTRGRLYGRLSEALRCRLTTVVAPAGYGKSTLVGSWLRSAQARFGWVSLDKGENDRLRFWTYVAAALDRTFSEPEEANEGERLSSEPLSAERAASRLIARLSERRETTVLVLDDYHTIDSELIHSDLYRWIGRLPAHVHVCVLSRVNVPFPVAAMRVGGTLCEIGMSELRFTDDEIASFWTGRTGTMPDEPLLRQLASRTEGWAAMLQLAVLSLPRSGDRAGARPPITGRHRHVADYMLEELFDGLDDELKRFLVSTSILERMNDSLCAAVTADAGKRACLSELERQGLFLIALDEERCWYRYHHLFADFLRSRLAGEAEADVAALHARAAEWFEANGLIEEAIHHAIEGGAYGNAADWLERHASIWLKRRETTTMRNWLDRMPGEEAERPLLLMLRVWTELMSGRYERVQPTIVGMRAMLRRLEAEGEAALAVRLREEVDIADNFCAILSGNFERALTLIKRYEARDDLPSRDVPILLGHGIELNEGTVPFIRGKMGFDGRVSHAGTYHRSYGHFLAKNDLLDFPYTAYQQAAMGEVLYERNRLDEAYASVKEAVRLGWTFGVLGAYVPAVICMADVLAAEGRREESGATVERAIRSMESRHMQTTRWYDKLEAKRARQRAAIGDAETARSWTASWLAKDAGEAGDAPAPVTDYERLACARTLMEQGGLDAAKAQTEALLRSARGAGNVMTELHALLLDAEIAWLRRRTEESAASLRAALRIGQAEGYVRSFADAGPFVLEALGGARGGEAKRDGRFDGIAPAYIRTIVEAFDAGGSASAPSASPPAIPRRPDALTARETDVLRLMARGLANKEIAARLVLTEGTVKLHLHRIYGKLQARGRVQAIREAERLGLLDEEEGRPPLR